MKVARNPFRLWTATVLTVAVVGFPGIESASADNPGAAHLLASSHREAGLALVLGDEALAETVAQSRQFLVVEQEAELVSFDAAARKADAAGLLANGRMRVVLAPAARPVLADASANVVFVLGPRAAEGIDPQALAAVLAPDGGTAFVEGATAEWRKGLPADVTSRSEGTLSILRRGRLPGGDDWPQPFHGPDQNFVSNDRVIGTALTPQWLGLPMYGTDSGIRTSVAAGGQLYVLQRAADGLVLNVRDLANGQILWQRAMKGETPTQASCLAVTTSDNVVVCLHDRVVRLNSAKGDELGVWRPDEREGATLNGLVYAGSNVLLVVSGPKEMPANEQIIQKIGSDVRTMSGDRLTALSATTGQVRWQWSAAGKPIDARSVVVSEGHVFFGFWDHHLTALDLADGKPAWSLDLKAPDLVAARAPEPKRLKFGLSDQQLPVMRAGQGVVLAGWPQDANLVAFNAADGHLLWSAWHGANSWLLREGRVAQAGLTLEGVAQRKASAGWAPKALHNSGVAYDLRTGAVSVEPGFGIVGCAQSIGSPLAYWSARNGPIWDNQTGAAVTRPFVNRTACWYGQLPLLASGTYVSGPLDTCICYERLRGWTAWRTPQSRAVRGERREILSDDSVPPAPEDDADWTQARGGPDHTGSSRSTLGKHPVVAWRAVPAHPYAGPAAGVYGFDPQFAPTPPVTVGRRAVMGGDDGAVRAFDAASGSPLWTAYTGGRILGTPAVMGGRVFVGSGDGHLWCFGLADGRPRWRFRLAPNEQSILAYGHLLSRWPVVGVLAEGGVVFAAAGFVNDDGGVVCALDGASGNPRWVRDFLDGKEPVCPAGGLVLDRGALWVRGASSTQVRLDAATGRTLGDIVRDDAMVDGADIGCFAGQFVVQGGRPWYWETREYFVRRNTSTEFTALDSAGAPLTTLVTLQSVGVTPAWDAHRMLGLYARADRQCWSSGSMNWNPTFQGGYRGLECWDAPGMARWLGEVRAAYPSPRRVDWGYMAWRVGQAKKTDPNSAMTVDLPPRPQTMWADPDTWIHTLALAADTALVICRAPSAAEPKRTVHVLRFCERDTGAVRAEQELPCAPVRNGIAIDRAGRVIVSLLDGSLVCFAAAPAAAADVSGAWEVTTDAGDQRTLTLAQNGSVLTGEVTDGRVQGTVTGTCVRVWLQGDPETLGTGTIDGDSITGTYTCSQEDRAGGWRAERHREAEAAKP